MAAPAVAEPGAPPPGSAARTPRPPRRRPIAPGSVRSAVTSTGVPEPSARTVRGSVPGWAIMPSPRCPTIAGTRDQSSSAEIRPVSDQSCEKGGGGSRRGRSRRLRSMLGACPDEAVSPENSPPDTFSRDRAADPCRGGVVVRDGKVLLVHRRATTTGRCPRASSTRARPSRTPRCGRSRRRPACAARSAASCPARVHGRSAAEGRALLAHGTEYEAPFEPNDEIDELRWLTPDEAMALISYDRDRDVLLAG